MVRKKDQPGTFELLTRLPGQIVNLARIEYENAKAEVISALKKISIGAVFLIIALFFLFWSIAAFGTAAIGAINLALPLWAAALIVAGGLLLLAVAAVLFGVWLLKRGNPVPEETLSRVSDDMVVTTGSIKYNAKENVAEERIKFGGRKNEV